MRKPLRATCWSVLGWCAAIAHPAFAQEAVPFPPQIGDAVSVQEAGPRGAVPKGWPDPGRIGTLKDGLNHVIRRSLRRGPMLVLGAEKTAPYQPTRDASDETWRPPTPLPPPESKEGWRLDVLAAHFGRKVTRVGSLTALTPTTMTILNTRLPADVDPMANLQSWDRMQLFQASLTEEQWRKMGTEQGLGLADMDQEQKELFLGMIPEKATLSRQRQATRWTEGIDLAEVKGLAPENRQGKLTAAQRMGARLRMNRTIRMWLPDAENGNTYAAWVPERPENTQYWSLSQSGDTIRRGEVFGVKVVAEVPARSKPSQLRYDLSDFDIDIAIGNAKTVGELVRRIAEVTGKEIRADARVSGLSVQWAAGEGDTVRAGDLLRALALAVTGTYRQVGTAYILTDDIEGIGARQARIREWAQQLMLARNLRMRDFWKRLRKMQPGRFIRYASGDPMAPDAKLAEKLEQQREVQRIPYRPLMVPAEELGPALKKQVDLAVKAHEENIRDNPQQRPVAAHLVQVQIETRTTLLLPGIGPVEFQMGGMGIDSMLPPPKQTLLSSGRSADLPFEPPTGMSVGGVLLFEPTADEDIPAAVDLAFQRGFRQLWVSLPLDPLAGRKQLEAVITEAKKRNLPVYAVLRLMQKPRTEKNAFTPVNILGETYGEWAARKERTPDVYPGEKETIRRSGEWFDPSDPATLPQLKRRILEIAATPGLAGIALRDIATPGFRTASRPNRGYEYVPESAADLGYSLTNRVALLREADTDPIDIITGQYGVPGGDTNINLPFFAEEQMRWVRKPNGEWGPDEKLVTARMRWNDFRFKITEKLLTDLHKAVIDEKPDIRLLSMPFGEEWEGNWFVSWAKGDSLPRSTREENPDPTKGLNMAGTVLLTVDITTQLLMSEFFEGEMPVQIRLNRHLNQSLEWRKESQQRMDGFILDVTGGSIRKVAPLLLAGIVPPGSRTAEK
ncbi:MAG: hypothetical protein SFU56_05745 [Capsulimonadales bacterium]|nr:hypothetical protein [Capsulimonadales bacterium]